MDGIIVINKHKGCTSHDIVYKVKKIFNKKVGHTGTLDPMATGVLPILVGKGTLCSKYLINHDKTYRAKIQLGKKTDSADAEGNIIEEQNITDLQLEKETLEKILLEFIGKQTQIPPMYSAIKVKGKKLYEYAREGEKIEMPPRDIEIYNIKLLDTNNDLKQLEFEVNCSKGTYIRSLCEDISEAMGTIGYMMELERLQVGEFDIKNSITVEELEDNKENNRFIENNIIKIEDIFKNKEKIILDDNRLRLFLNGVKLKLNKKDGVYKIYNNQIFIGVGVINNNLLKRDIIL